MFLFLIPFIVAQNETSSSDQTKINQAYDCLEDKIIGKCSSLSSEEKVFSLLSVGRCKSEVVADLEKNTKTTAQAILALDNIGSSTTTSEDWLKTQTSNPSDITWYLQIESNEPTMCTVTYLDSPHTVNINEDKKITSSAGNCLSLTEGGWWLKVSSTCFDQEFKISCDKSFFTSLIYKEQASATVYVSEEMNSASSGGTTTEKINSLCFTEGLTCNYESSLWATLALKTKGYEISAYLPYLFTMADANSKYLPEAFLYILTESQDFRTNLLLKQKENYWDESGEKFYDTALALYPFQYETPTEKSNSMTWLLENQDNAGCWQGNLRNTAFILHSVWPKALSVSEDDCTGAGYYCMSEADCEGSIVSAYNCAGVSVCCDTPKPLKPCSDEGGEICSSSETCFGGTEVQASNTDYGETCCVDGSCVPATPECESDYDGICRSFDCNDDEKEASYDCNPGETCCVKKKGSGLFWIIFLLLLCILVALAIIFRKKLRPYWFKLKEKFNQLKSKFFKGKPGPKPPPPYAITPQRVPQRRILPPVKRGPIRRPRTQKGDMNEVLQKLKEMGK